MKKEVFALLLLVGILTGSVLNLRYLKRFTHELNQCVLSVVSAAEEGDWTTAESRASDAMELWTEADKYTHVFIRHNEIDAVTEEFCSLLGATRSRDCGALYTAQLTLAARLDSLYEMERFKPGSIL